MIEINWRRKMKKLCVGIVILLSVNLVFADKIGALYNIVEPVLFEISDDNLYIVEGAAISIYSLQKILAPVPF
jgi:hypothetical protein